MTDQTNMHISFKYFLQQFKSLFKDGVKRFEDFIAAYRLDVTKPYGDQVTRECVNGVCEAFQWAKPFIQYLKEDEAGKYYKVRALTATVSANNNDYTDRTAIENSAPTLTYRPLNINHDRARWLPFPENRVDWAQYEDNAVECIIRIDNTQEVIQKQIESGAIVNPSIEARPIGGKRTEDGVFKPDMWNFTGLALLEKDETIPGVPTTFGIDPLFMTEGMAERLVESVDWNAERLEIEEKEMNKMSETEQTFSTHEPATKEELLEYWGNQSPSNCGYCKFFEMTQAVTVKTPAVTGAESDAFNTSSVGLGLGVGKCTVLEKLRGIDFLVKHSDWACGDGRPRDNPILVNRTSVNPASHESLDEVKTTSEIIELKRDIADLNEKLVDKEQENQKLREERSTRLHEDIDKQSQATEKEQSLSELQSKVSRLEKDRLVLREDNDKLKDSQADLDIELKRKDKDIEYYKEQVNRHKTDVESLKTDLADVKANLTHSYTKLEDATEKRAFSSQSLLNAEESKARLQTELSELHIKISNMTRQISDYAHNNSELAKARIADTEEVTRMRHEQSELEETLKDTRRELNQAKKRPTNIRVKI